MHICRAGQEPTGGSLVLGGQAQRVSRQVGFPKKRISGDVSQKQVFHTSWAQIVELPEYVRPHLLQLWYSEDAVDELVFK